MYRIPRADKGVLHWQDIREVAMPNGLDALTLHTCIDADNILNHWIFFEEREGQQGRQQATHRCTYKNNTRQPTTDRHSLHGILFLHAFLFLFLYKGFTIYFLYRHVWRRL